MGHVGDMHAYLTVAVGKAAEGNSVVKVLGIFGVDGKGGNRAEVLTTRYFFRRYAGIYLVGGLLHVGRIAVRQTELGENGVHLGGVLPFAAQDVDHLAAGIHLVVVPARDARYGFVAVLSPLEPAAGDDDVGGQIFGVGHERGIVALYFESAYEDLVFLLYYLHYLRLGILSLACGGDHDTHFVSVEGVHGVAFGYHNLLVVDYDGVASVGAAYECADAFVATCGVGFITPQRHFGDSSVGSQLVKHVDEVQALGRSSGVDGESYLFVVEGLFILFVEESKYTVGQF